MVEFVHEHDKIFSFIAILLFSVVTFIQACKKEKNTSNNLTIYTYCFTAMVCFCNQELLMSFYNKELNYTAFTIAWHLSFATIFTASGYVIYSLHRTYNETIMHLASFILAMYILRTVNELVALTIDIGFYSKLYYDMYELIRISVNLMIVIGGVGFMVLGKHITNFVIWLDEYKQLSSKKELI